MPDYVAIVKRSVDALPENNEEARKSVYERARAALIRQLDAVEPKLPETAVAAQKQSLEDAIGQVEAEQGAAAPSAAPGAVEPSAPPPPPVESSAPPPPPPPPGHSTHASPVQPGAQGNHVAPSVAAPAGGPTHTTAPSPVTPPPPVAPAPSGPTADHTGHLAIPAATAGAAGAEHAGHHAAAPDAQHSMQPGAAGAGQEARQRHFGAGPQDAASSGAKTSRRSSRGPGMIIGILVLLVALAIAAVAYLQWPTITALLGGAAPEEQQVATETEGSSQETQSSGVTTVEQTTQPSSQADSSNVRIVTPEDPNQSGQSTQLQQPVGPSDTAQQTDTASAPATTQQAPAASEQAPAASEQAPAAGEQAPAADQQVAATDSGQAEQVLVGQRAIFYEQGDGEAAGSAVSGGVSWQPLPQPNGLDAIQAVIDLPERQAKATVTITKNTDDGLPASHLIEISFDNVEVLSNGLIDRIPALVLKPSEQERGQPLVGAAVPVTPNLFWIALSDEGDQVTRNVALLREGSWFDIPILFDGGQRALLTFEKGVAGDQVFETVMTKWSQS